MISAAGGSRRLEMLRKDVGGDLEVAIDPEELDGLDEASVRALYEQRVAEMRAASQTEVRCPCTVWSHSSEEMTIMYGNRC